MQTKLHKNLKIAELPPLKIALILNFMLQLNILSRYFKLILHQTPALSNTAASRSKGSSNDWGCDFQTTTKTKPSEVEMSKKRQGDTTLASSKAASTPPHGKCFLAASLLFPWPQRESVLAHRTNILDNF